MVLSGGPADAAAVADGLAAAAAAAAAAGFARAPINSGCTIIFTLDYTAVRGYDVRASPPLFPMSGSRAVLASAVCVRLCGDERLQAEDEQRKAKLLIFCLDALHNSTSFCHTPVSGALLLPHTPSLELWAQRYRVALVSRVCRLSHESLVTAPGVKSETRP
ncbi:hypothetical protein E2C01_047983 [Portunus trituberculatus]|uniref:Uncharacterized protein n=1 Tax=Portunus trituberculatus TaxID=210409 RepID=A0A5B7G9C2_PORTR|nr:hypothetical protein [Portunus trituberculatus]